MQRTTAILLKRVQYGDRNLILQTFSRDLGTASFFMPASKIKGKNKVNLSALCQLEIVSTEGKSKLPSVREITLKEKQLSCLSDVRKASMLMFLNEVLGKCLREYQKDEMLFEFICASLNALEASHSEFSNFHLKFLAELSRFLGFYPSGQFSEQESYFDLMEGQYTAQKELHQYFLDGEDAKRFSDLMASEHILASELNLGKKDRKKMLEALMDYYRIHIERFDEVQSLEVLETVFSN